jgi:CheY-like chemotaxis protein
MDLQMPVMDGFEATEKIRAFYGASCPPIVAVTANVDSESRRRCEELQLDGFLAKPVRLEGLKDMLSQVGVTSE